MKIWLSNTNEVKTGGWDESQLVMSVPVKQGQTSSDIAAPVPFAKLALEGPDNMLNRCVVVKP